MKTLSAALLFLALLGWAGPGLASAHCTNRGACCTGLNTFWKTRLSKDFEIRGSDRVIIAKTFSCPSPQSRIVAGFKALYDLSRSKASTQNYYSIAKRNTKGYLLLLRPINNFAATYQSAKVIIFSTKFKDQLTPATRAGIIMHESIHAARLAPHILCKKGRYRGQKGCDGKLDQKITSKSNTYSWDFRVLHDIRQSTMSNYLKGSAKKMMEIMARSQFNVLPKFGQDGKTPFKRYYNIN